MTAVKNYPSLDDEAKLVYDALRFGEETYCTLLQWAVDNGLTAVKVVDPDGPDFDWTAGVAITPYDFSVHFSAPRPLTYSKTGTITGVTLDPDTGILSGTPANAGGGSPIVTATDGLTSAQVSFTWSAAVPFNIIESLGDNRYGFDGIFPGGTIIRLRARLTDPQGDVDTREYAITLPPGQHPGEVVAAVVAGEIDPQPHLEAEAAGATIQFSPAAASYELSTELWI